MSCISLIVSANIITFGKNACVANIIEIEVVGAKG